MADLHLLTVAQMREVERRADASGFSYAQMMQNAGRNAARLILERLARRLASAGPSTAMRVLVLCGPGNNGGDGLVCADELAESAGRDGLPITPQVYLLKPRSEDDPVFAAIRRRGLFVADADNDQRLRVLHQLVTHADVIIDALLGTGVSRPIDGVLRDMLREVRANRPPWLVALDGVTGMNYDTGALDPAAVPADLTITFHAPKRGHYCYPAAGACGELVVIPIGIAPAEDESEVCLATDPWVRRRLPARRADANKGAHGQALVVGGCSDYSGAPALSAAAAYRVGAGLVTLAVPPAIQPVVAAHLREATYLTTPGSRDSLSIEALPRIRARISEWITSARERHGLLVGPGMGQSEPASDFLAALLAQFESDGRPARMVLDADGLNLVAKFPDWPARLPRSTILTPHPGEMARLTGLSVAEVQADRIGCALRYAAEWGHIVVLKGAHTVMADPNGTAVVAPFANPAMAVAGTGDVLAGAIAGLLAQGLAPFDAAVCGVYAHAKAGALWRDQQGDAGMLAGDLLPLLPAALRAIHQAADAASKVYDSFEESDA